MTYSTDNDVLRKISHIKVPSGLSISKFRDDAYVEINVEIRDLYVVPVASSDDTDMNYLKVIEQDLAAGKLLLDVSTVHQLEELHAYAEFLITKANDKIIKLSSQDIVLVSAGRNTDSSNDVIDPPIIQGKAADKYSTFNRPISGIENDAIEGVVDSGKYNSLTDNKTI